MVEVPTGGSDPRSTLQHLEDCTHQELVIGLVGRVSSGVSTAGDSISEILKNEFGYQTYRTKVSDLIRKRLSLVREDLKNGAGEVDKAYWDSATPESLSGSPASTYSASTDPELSRADRIKRLQDVGNALRRKKGSSFLAECAALSVLLSRQAWLKEHGRDLTPTNAVRGPRFAHIVDSLKHPDEARLLRRVYGENFILVAVMASEISIKQSLRSKGLSVEEIEHILQRDASEQGLEGQQVIATSKLSDIYLRNNFHGSEQLNEDISRFFSIVFGKPIHTPTNEEMGMMYAKSAAVRSACLSQQVGAAILSASGEMLSVGYNEVPEAGGGTYTNDSNHDCRCFQEFDEKKGHCRKDHWQEETIGEIYKGLKKLGYDGKLDKAFKDTLRATGLRTVLEQSRSIHAEMNAITAVARMGGNSLKGATLYTTVFPCHNCARHIIAAGISRVVFLDPYDKSSALDLHADAISFDEMEVGDEKVLFVPFSGISPDNIIKYFQKRTDRKSKLGFFVPKDPSKLIPIGAESGGAFVTSEQACRRSASLPETNDEVED